jgi:hypothetical protein
MTEIKKNLEGKSFNGVVREALEAWAGTNGQRVEGGVVFFTTLTYLGFELTAALDRHGTGKISLEEMQEAIDQDRVWSLLQSRYPGIDLSLLDEAWQKALMEAFDSLRNTMSPRRKLGVEHDGVCLLLGYLFEMCQHPSYYRFPLPHFS